MTSPDPLTTTSKCARQALELMEQYKIPATPDNFSVWFSYVNGGNLGLVKTINDMRFNDAEFTETFNTETFQQYCAADGEDELREMALRIEGAVAKVVEYIGTATSQADQYGTSLEDISGKLAKTKNHDDVTLLVQDILTATQTMISVNNALSHRLTSTSQEAARLKQDMEALRLEASVDHLTKLSNRKWFDQTMSEAHNAAERDQKALAILMVDIDFFKKFNDTYGHQLGDQVLKLVAKTITECVDAADTAARYGGEEFGIILPGATLKAAIAKAEKIRKAVAGRKVTNRTTGEVLGEVTLSVGAALYHPGDTIGELVHRADEALYFAKRSGRNRVCSETDLLQKP